MYYLLITILFIATNALAVDECQQTFKQYSDPENQQFIIDKDGKIVLAPAFDRSRSQKTPTYHRINYTTNGFRSADHTVTMFYDSIGNFTELRDEKARKGEVVDIKSYKFDNNGSKCKLDRIDFKNIKDVDKRKGHFVLYDRKTCDDLVNHFKKITSDKKRYQTCIKDMFEGRQILAKHEQRLNKDNAGDKIQLQTTLFDFPIMATPLAQSEVYLAGCIARRPDDKQLVTDFNDTIKIINDLDKTEAPVPGEQ